MPSPSPDLPGFPPLAGQLVVFTGKLSSLGRRDAHALVSRLGGQTADDVSAQTTMLVVGAEGFGRRGGDDGSEPPPAREGSSKLRRAAALNARRPQIQILTEDQFCQLVGLPTAETLKQQFHAQRDLLTRYRSLREDQLRYLLKCGVLSPAARTNADSYFGFADVALIKQVNHELERGVPFLTVARGLLASREGQLRFDFRLDADPAKIVVLRPPAEPPAARNGTPKRTERALALAEEYFRSGALLDDGDPRTRDEAAAAYRKALALDPYLVAALINLANIHYSCDEIAEAQALYERAIGLEPTFFEAHFNLGNIYHDLGELNGAEACYREALHLNPLYPDAHFYLAVTYEKLGRSDDAKPHWRAYRQLAPNGDWVELAKEFSE